MKRVGVQLYYIERAGWNQSQLEPSMGNMLKFACNLSLLVINTFLVLIKLSIDFIRTSTHSSFLRYKLDGVKSD